MKPSAKTQHDIINSQKLIVFLFSITLNTNKRGIRMKRQATYRQADLTNIGKHIFKIYLLTIFPFTKSQTINSQRQ